MTYRKVNEATSADWSFMDDSAAVKAVEYAAHRAAREFETAEWDDCYQEGALWLAVRPEVLAKYREQYEGEELPKVLGYRIYSDALREALIAESDRSSLLVSMPDAEGEGW